VRQYAAVRAAVCGSVWQCTRQCTAIWQCGSVQQCVAVHGCVQQCARLCVCNSVRGGVWQCVMCVGLCVAVFGSERGSVRALRAVRAAVYGRAIGSVQQCVAVCGSASVRRIQCVAVHSTYLYTKSLTIYIPLQGQWE
jgi:hypothetical protein